MIGLKSISVEERIVDELISTVAEVQREIERMFENFWSRVGSKRPLKLGAWEPPVDVIDRDGEIVIYVDVPGFSKDEVRVKVTEDAVEVTAEKKEETAVTQENYVVRERVRTALFRRIELPAKVRPEEAKAKLENGVLEIRIPKSGIAREVQITIE